MKVLYIDDQADKEAFDSLKDLLELEDIDVEFETSVQGAISRMENREEYDIIVLDVIMPPLGVYTLEETEGGLQTGFRLLTDLKEGFRGTPIVIVSIKRNEAGEALKNRLGVADYLEKPIEVSKLAQALKKITNERK